MARPISPTSGPPRCVVHNFGIGAGYDVIIVFGAFCNDCPGGTLHVSAGTCSATPIRGRRGSRSTRLHRVRQAPPTRLGGSPTDAFLPSHRRLAVAVLRRRRVSEWSARCV